LQIADFGLDFRVGLQIADSASMAGCAVNWLFAGNRQRAANLKSNLK
jgi:hypothetical protein